MQDDIQFKGIRQGILVTLPVEREWAALVADLASRIDEQPGFFQGAKVVLQINKRAVRQYELDNLINLLKKRNVELIAVMSSSATSQGATHKLGLATELEDLPSSSPVPVPTSLPVQGPEEENQDKAPTLPSQVEGTEGILIHRTLRSGMTIHSAGHVVVIGDVNPGAEIIASGDIVVWGRIRGVVHAGADGNTSCVVCALDLQPTQLRISSLISISPPSKRRRPRPERAYVENGQIRAEAWKPV
jgi:septum site-determining protein MinC